jgi:prepilin-type N-terminal cleavage/methylation domain-containing protein
MSRSTRYGFTFVELIVVLGIIGILIGLFLPAVRKVREPANRAKCQSQLKQLGIAVHNYASTYGDHLPPAYGRMTIQYGGGEGVGGSILFWLLPYVEQDALFRTAYTNGGGNRSGPGGPLAIPIKVFACPSDVTSVSGFASTQPNTACVSYVANYLLFGHGDAMDPWDTSYSQLPRYTTANIPDGSSNTAMFCEHSAVSLDNGSPKVMVYGPDNGGLPAGTVLPLFNYAGHDAAPPTWDGNSDPAGVHEYFWMPQFSPTALSGASPATYRMVQGYHTATIIVGLADCSVRGVSASVSSRTWQQAIYPSDGVPLGSDW